MFGTNERERGGSAMSETASDLAALEGEFNADLLKTEVGYVISTEEPAFLETPDAEEQDEAEQPVLLLQPLMSGHCRFPQTAEPHLSHERCHLRNNGGSRANPLRIWQPCPCSCHLGDTYECGNCGRLIAEAPLWDGEGGEVYVHIDADGDAIGEDCS